MPGVTPELNNIKELKDIVEARAVQRALERNEFNRSATAKELGIDKSTLFRRKNLA